MIELKPGGHPPCTALARLRTKKGIKCKMTPSKKIINVNLKDAQEKVKFFEKLQDIDSLDMVVKTKNNSVRIKVSGSKNEVNEFFRTVKKIVEGIGNEGNCD